MINKQFFKGLLAALLSLFIVVEGNGQRPSDNVAALLNAYNVSWDTPGPSSLQSMPLGNGDISLNVWAEPTGDLAFYIGKTDAWGTETKERGPWMKEGGVLMKLGLVRIAISPNPLANKGAFLQVLKLHEGEIQLQEGAGANAVTLRIWVDANHPVIRVAAKSQHPVSVKVKLENWRIGDGDTVLNKVNQVAWYHYNPATADPHLKDIVFGAVIKGPGLVNADATTLQSKSPATTQLISVYPLTQTTGVNNWLSGMNKQVADIDGLNLEQTWAAHRRWWDNFWHRSWIFIQGDDQTKKVNEGYILQRFVTACAGRGAYPIKFNGSLFVVDNPAWMQNRKNNPVKMDADFRDWGGQYWFQNTRAMYWPRLMAGDFDIMLPLFKMYAGILPGNAELVQQYYHHDGAYFAETAPFWGGLLYMGPEVPENWTAHYFTPILELSMMMLDYYEYTGDQQFAKEILLPVATAGIRFFDKHFSRDAQGKLLLDPDNSIEMFWKVHNPAPDIAGLHAVVHRLAVLPDGLVSKQQRSDWQRFESELPVLPVGVENGKEVLLPYSGPQTAKGHNLENPELYAVYPFRLYGVGKPDLQLAINSFNNRKFRDKGCWVQDPIQAAMLGQTAVAKMYTSFNLTRKDPSLKFPAFWDIGHDYMPDEDNGGNGENGLQQMLMQTDGKKIMLLPAWPAEWGNVSFKLNAPYRTTVEGKVVNGKLTDLVITPASRKGDVIDMSTANR
ncbi:DUF5703 domain-containing protein [Chitinophaga sp. 30R24]|uniref:DUF5703 domain-containing protein n=1 Tax=Chitinophaga sp. 30R24 TaxID=3248838 RepID=UPI003B909303